MPEERSAGAPRVPRWWWAVGLVALGGAALRLAAHADPNPLAYPVGYDEGAYFAGSAAWVRGAMPYRDFVFVHPPGVIVALAPLARLGNLSQALGIARVAMGLVGVANIVLVAWILGRRRGGWAAVVGAAIYATYAAAVDSEHRIYLEPLLNLFALAGVAVWMVVGERARPAGGASDRRDLVRAAAAGALLGLGITMKLAGPTALLACVVTPPDVTRRWRPVAALVAGAAAAVTLVGLPFVLASPGDAWAQVVGFQLARSPDGIAARPERLALLLADPRSPGALWDSRHLAGAVAALAGLAVCVVRRRHRLERLVAIWYLATFAGFLASSSYWDSYNTFLAAPTALLGGLATSALVAWARRRDRAGVAIAAGVVALALVVHAAAWSWSASRVRDDAFSAIATQLPALVGRDRCVASFDAVWLLADDRVPATGERSPAVDSYAAIQLAEIEAGGAKQPNVELAFDDPRTERAVGALLGSCDRVLVGDRGMIELGEHGRQRLREAFEPMATLAPGVDLWRRKGT